jgi:hypothetical protein
MTQQGIDVRYRLPETLGALCLLGIVTLAQSPALRLTGKMALCSFAFALPLLVTSWVAHKGWFRDAKVVFVKYHGLINIVACLVTLFGFGSMLWELYPLAAGVFIATCVMTLIIISVRA